MLVEVFTREVSGKVKWMMDTLCATMVGKERSSPGFG